MSSGRKYINYVTPPGVAAWVKLDKPDVYQPKKGDPKIRYKLDIDFGDQTGKVKADIAKLIEVNGLDVGDNENSPFREETKKDEKGKKIKTGRTLLGMFSGQDRKPVVVDAKNGPVPPALIGSGSTVRAKVTLNAYDGFGGGVNLYLNGVQVLKLVEPQARVQFDEADGFEYDGPTPEEESKNESGSSSREDMDDEIPF